MQYLEQFVCANVTSIAVTDFSDMSLLIDFCIDYRTYLRRQVSSILSKTISSFDLNFFNQQSYRTLRTVIQFGTFVDLVTAKTRKAARKRIEGSLQRQALKLFTIT